MSDLGRGGAGSGDGNGFDGYKAGATAFISLSSTALNDANVAFGTAGGDTPDAGGGNDTLHGRAGDDCPSGNKGSAVLFGGPGADALYGEAGNDVLVGGYGADRLTGGAGKRHVPLHRRARQRPHDHRLRARADRIDLSLFKVAGADYHSDAQVDATRFSTGHDRTRYYDGYNAIVLGNTDANPDTAAFALTLAGRAGLGAADFIL